jgi:hypothetical protein
MLPHVSSHEARQLTETRRGGKAIVSGAEQAMNPSDVLRKLHSLMPLVRKWIEATLAANQKHAIPLFNLASPQLRKLLPLELLMRAKAVVVTGKVPFPPLSSMGLPEFSQMENMDMAGVTYKDMIFVNQHHQTDSIYFHELVHVVQWERLGVNDFLLAYGAGLLQFGYEASPLEAMAYSLQASYDRGKLPKDTIELIKQRTGVIWSSVSALFPKSEK